MFLYLPFVLPFHRRRFNVFIFLLVVVIFSFVIFTFTTNTERAGNGFRLLAKNGGSKKISVSLGVFDTTGEVATSDEKSRMRGLNTHIWNDLCMPSIQALCDYPLFHMAPNEKIISRKLDIVRNDQNYGQRIFGYLHPPNTGKYKFAIASDDSSELWLSPNEDTSSAIMICNSGERNEDYVLTEKGNFKRFPSQISAEIELQKDQKYYIEILHLQGGGLDFIQVAWYKPGASMFKIIDDNSLSVLLYDNDNDIDFESVPSSVACDRAPDHSQVTMGNSQYLSHDAVKDALPYCKYGFVYPPKQDKNSKEIDRRSLFLDQYYFPTYSYPPPLYENVQNLFPAYGEQILDAKTAGLVAKHYLNSLHENYPGKFKVLALLNAERKSGHFAGHRYLLEFKVIVTGQTEPLMISEYVFQPKNSSTLCYPEGLQWNRKAKIALVITVKDQGRWMIHFLNNLQKIYAASQDHDVRLVIFNYDSSDIDLEQEIARRKLPSTKLINHRARHYSRSKSFNEAVKEVEDPHTIIFALDLHLELPNSLFDDIRKHCFEGLSVYTPIIIRLSCEGLPGNPKGRWEPQGFGLIGIFKSDWDRVGGLNEEYYDENWGGEDWDLMDRVVRRGLEYERVRHPEIFHFFHTRKGLWTGDKDIQDEASD